MLNDVTLISLHFLKKKTIFLCVLFFSSHLILYFFAEKGVRKIEDVEQKCSSWTGSAFRCMDHDKVVVFIRDINLK